MLCNYLVLGGILFGLGFIGFVVRRNLIVMFLCVEMMLQGVSLSLAAWGRYHNDWGGQILVLFIITVAACEAGIALALILMLFHRAGSLDMAHWQSLREQSEQPFVDRELPSDDAVEQQWPQLTPAGIEPEPDHEEEYHRSNV